MTDISISPAWRLRDTKFENDAAALWSRLGQLPTDSEGAIRAQQLSSVAYDGDNLIGVTTAFIDVCELVRANLSFYRILVDPDYRGKDIMPPLVMMAFNAIEAWAKENPQANVAGLGSVRQSEHLTATFKSPYARSTGAILIGYTPIGDQIRVRWFEHYRPS